MLVPGKDHLDTRPLEAFERVAGVVDNVPLTAGSGNREQVMVEDEDPQVGLVRELLLDPAVTPPADLSVVEVGLGRVDCDHRHGADAQDGVALAEELLEVDVADVAGVVVPRDDDERLAAQPVEIFLRLHVLGLEPERGQVPRAYDQIRREIVDLRDRALHEIGHEVGASAVEIGDMRDREPLQSRHG